MNETFLKVVGIFIFLILFFFVIFIFIEYKKVPINEKLKKHEDKIYCINMFIRSASTWGSPIPDNFIKDIERICEEK